MSENQKSPEVKTEKDVVSPLSSVVSGLAAMFFEELRYKGGALEIPSLNIRLNGKTTEISKPVKPTTTSD